MPAHPTDAQPPRPKGRDPARAARTVGCPKTKTQRRRARRHKANAARRAGGSTHRADPAIWVVDTGASRHVCPPRVAGEQLRPSRAVVDTANGTVRAAGEATVRVEALGHGVDAIVLPSAPCLLSVGQLVADGYELRWGPRACRLVGPRGAVLNLGVVDGIPCLLGEHPDGAPNRAAAGVGAVRAGVEEQHRQVGHYPWQAECSVCNEAGMRSEQHRRRLPHAGVLAVDILSMGTAGPHMLVGATQLPGWVYAEPVRGKSAADLRAPVLRMLLSARGRGDVHTVHADKEGGIAALEPHLLGVGVRMSTTQGHDPQGNGLAEQAVGQLSRMARAVLAEYGAATAARLWQPAVLWSAQRLADPKLPPFGAKVLARHAPKAKLGKLDPRATDAIFLHWSPRVPGAAVVGLLGPGGAVVGIADRRTIRASVDSDGRWLFPSVRSVLRGLHGRPTRDEYDRGEHAAEDEESGSDQGGAWLPEDYVPFGERFRMGSPTVAHGDHGDSAPVRPTAAPQPAGAEHMGSQGAKRPLGMDTADAETPVKRQRWDDLCTGMVTRQVELGSPDAATPEAIAAVKKEMGNMLAKGVFDPADVLDWAEVKQAHPDAIVGRAKMILGIKNSELPASEWVHKGRLVFMGNNLRGASGERVLGTADGLYGAPINLATARMVVTTALLRDWAVEAADVDGAYLMADLKGPPVYLRLPKTLWEASGADRTVLDATRGPCLRVRKAMYGLPRAGFDWFSHCDKALTDLGWQRHSGVDSVYYKTEAVLAVYVDDLLLAGTPHARRREWAAIRRKVKLRGEPERLSRFLGVKYEQRSTGPYTRVMRATESEYVDSVVKRPNEVAAHPAGARAAPAQRQRRDADAEGDRAADCRSFVGSLMYIVRATRPDATFAVNRLARNVSAWTTQDDADLEQVVGYLGATADVGLELTVDVRDRKDGLWLELWVDSDHAGHADRTSTGGWVLMLRGVNGTNVAIDWASRKQATVARSSGEAETVALADAVKAVAGGDAEGPRVAAQLAVGVNRGLCASGIPTVDFLEKALGQAVPTRVMVDAAVAKAAAEKGTSRQMKHLSKAQGVELFWPRDMVTKIPLDVRKVDGENNIADVFTKALTGPRTVMIRERIGALPPPKRP